MRSVVRRLPLRAPTKTPAPETVLAPGTHRPGHSSGPPLWSRNRTPPGFPDLPTNLSTTGQIDEYSPYYQPALDELRLQTRPRPFVARVWPWLLGAAIATAALVGGYAFVAWVLSPELDSGAFAVAGDQGVEHGDNREEGARANAPVPIGAQDQETPALREEQIAAEEPPWPVVEEPDQLAEEGAAIEKPQDEQEHGAAVAASPAAGSVAPPAWRDSRQRSEVRGNEENRVRRPQGVVAARRQSGLPPRAEADYGRHGQRRARGAVTRRKERHREVRNRIGRRAEAPGYLTIDSAPYASIFVDGQRVGDTPLVRIPLSPGRHKVRAEVSDGSVKTFTIRVESGATVRRRVADD